MPRRGTLALSWGPSGGFYLHHHRICLGPLALTYVPAFEIDDLMKATVGRDQLLDALTESEARFHGVRIAIENYADHQSWRCDHEDRWPHDPDCPCGLVAALTALGLEHAIPTTIEGADQ